MSEKYNDCPACQGRTWVCEQHPELAYEHELPDGSICSGPGVPCEVCGEGITFADGMKVYKDAEGQYDYLPVSRHAVS